MLVVILAIASFLVFIGTLVLLWVADRLESREFYRKTMASVAKPFALLSVPQAFDPTYSLLWEEPITALELIHSARRAGIPVSRLQPIFCKAAARLPEVYDGFTFVDWLRFLEEAQLISWTGYRIALTADGQDFLRYRFTTSALVEASETHSARYTLTSAR
jgi:hypothetical protein